MRMNQMMVNLAVLATLGASAPATFARAPGNLPTTTASATEYDRAQVSAATANAYVNLRKDVERNWIMPQLTVGEFVRRAHGEDALRVAVRQAQQIGGPRWIDDQTCQIKVETTGTTLARALVEIARNDPQRTMSADEVERRLADWDRRSFSATGTSIAANKVHEVRPIGAPAWRAVDDASRVAAVDAARENAVARVLDDLRSIRLSETITVGDVLSRNEAVANRLTELLRNRPVTSIQFRDDLQVQYTLSVSRRELVETFVEAAKKAGVELPPDATQEKLHPQFRQEITSTTGVAVARAGNNVVMNAAPNLVPAQPPRWVFDQIDASGSAKFRNSPLHTKQDAEDSATDAIRSKLLAMKLSEGLTLGEAADRDPAIRAAVDRALSRARTFKVDYDSDGSVSVKMMLDPRELWTDLSRP
ncbi:MAG: hypothetical protein H7Z14_00500 [Anaerolineae bacterium]|nr:hypothetical protein [Phycisphaerae bacterium]